jgi:tRNA(Leu) C34 or U34 (ribose-2'-O)-methylase TrmL
MDGPVRSLNLANAVSVVVYAGLEKLKNGTAAPAPRKRSRRR